MTPSNIVSPEDDGSHISTATIKRERPCCVRGYDVHSTKLKCVPRIPKLAEGKQSLAVLKIYYKKLWIR